VPAALDEHVAFLFLLDEHPVVVAELQVCGLTVLKAEGSLHCSTTLQVAVGKGIGAEHFL